MNFLSVGIFKGLCVAKERYDTKSDKLQRKAL